MESVVFATPSAPANNGTAVLFSSVSALGAKSMRMLGLDMVELTMAKINQASAANGLTCSISTDGGTTWLSNTLKDDNGVDTFPVTTTATEDVRTWRVVVSPYADVKFEWTAGATAPTDWEWTIVGHFGAAAVAR